MEPNVPKLMKVFRECHVSGTREFVRRVNENPAILVEFESIQARFHNLLGSKVEYVQLLAEGENEYRPRPSITATIKISLLNDAMLKALAPLENEWGTTNISVHCVHDF